jgi:hypothetical protein
VFAVQFNAAAHAVPPHSVNTIAIVIARLLRFFADARPKLLIVMPPL